MVDSNRATDGFGFRVEGSGHVVVRNDSARNSVPSFTVTGTGHRFTDNEATDNLFDGFRVEATGSAFAGNASSLNSRLGIADLTTGGGTAGTANTYTDNTCVGNGLATRTPRVCAGEWVQGPWAIEIACGRPRPAGSGTGPYLGRRGTA